MQWFFQLFSPDTERARPDLTSPGAIFRSSRMIHIGRAGAQLGSFSEFEVGRGLKSGQFLLTDLGWKQGMEHWAPLSQFPEFNTPPEPMPPLPGEEPFPDTGAPPAEVAQAGLPWDMRKEIGFFRAFAETARLVMMNPSEAFSRMLASGSLAGPLLFNLIGGWFGLICAGVYLVISSRVQPPPPPNLQGLDALFNELFNFTPERAMKELQLLVFMGPVIATVSTLFSSAVAHLFLMLAGGANKPYHVTLRVFCFSYGSVQLLQILPFAGNLLAPILQMVYCVLGLAIAHGTTTLRSVMAVFLFLLAGCVCCVGMIFMLYVSAGYALPHP
jgi:hypothetical protein